VAPLRKVLRIHQVLELTGLTRGTVYRFVKEDSFPQPIQLGPKLLGWWEHEVEAWLATRPRGLHSAEDARRLRSVPRRVPA
jgi:prophage regulatory protein